MWTKNKFLLFSSELFSYNFISLYIISGMNWKFKEKTNLFFSLANVYDKAHWRNAPKTRLHSYKSLLLFFKFKNASEISHRMLKLSMSGFLLKPLTDEGLLNPGPRLPNIFLLKKNFNLWNNFVRTLVVSSPHWCLLSLFAFNKPRSQCILWSSCLNLKLYNHSSFELFYS